MSIFSLCGVMFVCICAVVLIKENGYNFYALILSSFAVVMAALLSFGKIGQAFEKLNTYISHSGIAIYTDTVLKAFGVAFVCDVSSDMLAELGSEKMGKWIECAGKAEMLLLSIPLVSEILDKAVSLL